MQFRFSFFLMICIFSSCLDLDEEKKERERLNGPDSLQKKEISPLDTVFMIHIKNDKVTVTGLGICTFKSSWPEVDTLLGQALKKKPGVTVYIEDLGSDPKTVDTAEAILIRYNINEYMRFTNPKYPVYSKKFIEQKK